MNKQSRHIVMGGILVGIGITLYILLRPTIKTYAKTIVRLGGSDGYATLLTFDKGFLKSWSKALKAGQNVFSYQGKNYNTKGGTAVTGPSPVPGNNNGGGTVIPITKVTDIIANGLGL